MEKWQHDTLVDNLKDNREPEKGDIVYIPWKKEYWIVDKRSNVKVFPLEQWFEAGNTARRIRGEEPLVL